jgi:hypothetical protein
LKIVYIPQKMSFPMPESDSAFSLEKTNRLRGMLMVGIFIFHFCGMFPYDIVPGVGHLLVGAFFMLSGFGLMEPDLATLRFLNAVWPIRHFGLRIASAAPSIVMGSLQESESGTNPGIPAYFRPDIVEDLP